MELYSIDFWNGHESCGSLFHPMCVCVCVCVCIVLDPFRKQSFSEGKTCSYLVNIFLLTNAIILIGNTTMYSSGVCRRSSTFSVQFFDEYNVVYA